MLCNICKKNKVDGRKGPRTCQECLDNIKEERAALEIREKAKCDEIFIILEKLLTQEAITEATARIRSNSLHQMITKMIAYELISSHTIKFKEVGTGIEADLVDAFVKSAELEGITTGTSYVAYVMENLIRKVKDDTERELKEKGIEEPESLGYLIAT